MTPEDLKHPSWEKHGWTPSSVRVSLYASGHLEDAHGLTHPDAPGLALVGYTASGREHVTFTHLSTGTNVGLLHGITECPVCPGTILAAARAACEVIDFVTITMAEAQTLPISVRDRARAPFYGLDDHECDDCAWWHTARLPKRIAELEEEVKELEAAEERAAEALAEAEEDCHAAREELRELKKRLKAVAP